MSSAPESQSLTSGEKSYARRLLESRRFHQALSISAVAAAIGVTAYFLDKRHPEFRQHLKGIIRDVMNARDKTSIAINAPRDIGKLVGAGGTAQVADDLSRIAPTEESQVGFQVVSAMTEPAAKSARRVLK